MIGMTEESMGGYKMEYGIEIGEHNRPEVITVNLLEDEEAINIRAEKNQTDWDYLFTDEEEYRKLMLHYNKKVKEFTIPKKQEYAVFSNYNPVKVELETEIKGKKIWLDDGPKNRPKTIIIYLLADNQVVDRKIVKEKEDWKYSFTNIPLYDEERNKITYTIEEKPVDGYQTLYENYDVKNLRVDQTSAKIVKDWMHADKEKNKIPKSITVSLLQNGKEIKEIELSAKNNWQYQLAKLDVFDENGKAYNYSMKEEVLDYGKGHPTKLVIGEKDLSNERKAKNTGIALLAGTALALIGLAVQVKEKIKE